MYVGLLVNGWIKSRADETNGIRFSFKVVNLK